ncbi:MAG: hypothetical protein ACU836_01970 [Gammaproteobacteria bacterium]
MLDFFVVDVDFLFTANLRVAGAAFLFSSSSGTSALCRLLTDFAADSVSLTGLSQSGNVSPPGVQITR